MKIKKEKVYCSVCGKLAGKGLSHCYKHHGEWAYNLYREGNTKRENLETLLKAYENTMSALKEDRDYLKGKIDGIKLATGMKEELPSSWSKST